MNPFVYPKSKHTRTLNPGPFSSYTRYKPFLREEFERKCVYCRMPDTMPGKRTFGADHYRPKKHFPQLVATYTNLFYCCSACNSRKGSYWPSNPQALAARFIPNPCDHEMFRHLRFKRSMVETKSLAGEFTEEHLDLNDPEAVAYRNLILDTIDAYVASKAKLQSMATKIQAKVTNGIIPSADAAPELLEIDSKLKTVDSNLQILTASS